MSELTRQQLCAELQVSESTVKRLEGEGMPFTGEGRAKRYDLSQVKDWSRVKHVPKPKPGPVEVMRDTLLRSPTLMAHMGLDPANVAKWKQEPPKPPPTKEELRAQRAAERLAEHQRELERTENRAALVLFHSNKRRAAKLKRTPPWSDLDAMRAIYAKAQRMTRETGIPHHVDHEYPLQGELVSGLHVPNNLQILTGSENSKKRNRFEIEP